MKIKRFSKSSIIAEAAPLVGAGIGVAIGNKVGDSVIKRNIRKEAEKNYNPDKVIESLEKDSKQLQSDSKKAKKKADEALKRGNEKEYFYWSREANYNQLDSEDYKKAAECIKENPEEHRKLAGEEAVRNFNYEKSTNKSTENTKKLKKYRNAGLISGAAIGGVGGLKYLAKKGLL